MKRSKENITAALEKCAAAELTMAGTKPDPKLDHDANEDYRLARETMRDIVKKSADAMDIAISLASESEHPRSIEVLASLMKSTADVTEQLMKLQRHRQDLDQNKESPKTPFGGGPVTNNNLFVGTTAALQKLIASGGKIEEADIIGGSDE